MTFFQLDTHNPNSGGIDNYEHTSTGNAQKGGQLDTHNPNLGGIDN